MTSYLPTVKPWGKSVMELDHWSFSTAHFTYHRENEHSLQFQSYNSYTKQM